MFMHLNEINEPISQCVDCVPNLGIQLKKRLEFSQRNREERGLNYSLYLNCSSIYKCDMMYMYAMQTGNY